MPWEVLNGFQPLTWPVGTVRWWGQRVTTKRQRSACYLACLNLTACHFGLYNALMTFKSLMARIFGDKHFQPLLLYLDNVVVFSTCFDQCLACLQMMMVRFREHCLKVKWSKWSLFQRKVSYLGYVISVEKGCY